MISTGTMFFLLAVASVAALFFVCGTKSLRALLSLGVTITLLFVAVIPLVISGHNPVAVILVIAIPVTFLVIYLTEGFNERSHLSALLTITCFFLVSLLAYLAVSGSTFTGITSDEAITAGGQLGIDLPKLLVASIMLSTLGALIEMIVTQVSTVTELIEANPGADRGQIYRQSYKVGTTHLGSIINTLFLIYAGVLLPTLIVFSGSQDYLSNILSYEPTADEIVRILVGTLGLIIAMPTSTYFAAYWLTRNRRHGGTGPASHVEP